MAIPISSCCLLASPRVDPIHWQIAFYTGELTDDIPDERKAAVAKEFIELQVDREGIEVGETDTDVLLTTVHPGHVNRCAGIDFAGVMKLNQSREMRRHVVDETFTVCGMVLETGECYSGLWVAPGPLLAASAVWDYFQEDEQTLLVSCVHEGIIPRAEWTPTYADPTCLTDVAMLSRLAELVPAPEESAAKQGLMGRIKQRWAGEQR
jgi:hypothetical protein